VKVFCFKRREGVSESGRDDAVSAEEMRRSKEEVVL